MHLCKFYYQLHHLNSNTSYICPLKNLSTRIATTVTSYGSINKVHKTPKIADYKVIVISTKQQMSSHNVNLIHP